jgi:CRISPR/Cas system-associated exonuclease Cas4 (RecB family)
MTPFLKLVADDLFKEFGKEISNINLVFPNRRASLFFNKYLTELIEEPIWQPSVITISDLMYRISGLNQVDPVSLIIKLYDIYSKQLHSQETFDSFYFWGEVMLADFDQIDKYRVDSDKLFTNIVDIKEIDERFGGFSPEQLEALKAYLGVMTDSTDSIIKDRYLSIWRVLGSIYKEFRSQLNAEGLCYEGLAYSIAASKLDSRSGFQLDGTYAFIGFNALNECEKSLLRYLKKSGKALFYWDYDIFYTQSDVHEAALFLRDNLNEFPNKLSSTHFNNFGTDSTIYLISAPSGVTQAKLIPQIVEQLRVITPELNINTAIILPEEHLLLPVISALPENIGELNITMGYPLKETAAYNLAEFLIKLHVNARSDEEGSVRFYHKDVLSVLNHPYLQIVDSNGCTAIIKRINTENIIFVDSNVLNGSPAFQVIFVKQSSGNGIVKYLAEVSRMLAGLINQSAEKSTFNGRIELEYIYALYTNLTRLGDVIDQNGIDLSIKIFRQLFRKALLQVRVSFSGEPLSGLQVMGFLETRTLDFENIIMLSVNDDVLPGNHHRPSFITPSLRFAYRLPDYSHQDAMYAYYFYRLLQRSKQVYLVFRNRAEGLASGELSRFVLQLLMESGKKIERIDVKFDLGIASPSEISIDKQEGVISKLNRYLTSSEGSKYLSPSAFTAYLNCPLQFYYRYIADIREPDEVAEEVDLPGFGKILHAVMELVYSSIGKDNIDRVDLDQFVKNPLKLEQLIDSAYTTVYLKTEKENIRLSLAGRNLLVLDQIKYSINKMLKTDIKRTPFRIIKQEETVSATIEFAANGKAHRLRIGGIVDRLDTDGNTIRVVDYKTGSADKKGVFSSIDDLFDPKKCDKVKEVFQIFTYCYALKQQEGYNDIKPELWFVRNTASDYLPRVSYTESKVTSEVHSFNAWENDFVKKLKELLAEIFDTSKPFNQTTDEKICKKCAYMSICGRR